MSLQLVGQRPERRRAGLWRHRPAAGPVDQRDHRPDHRHADHGRQLQRRRRGQRRRQQRARQLRLDHDRRPACGRSIPLPSPAPQLAGGTATFTASDQRHQRALQLELRRRHAGDRLFSPSPTVTHIYTKPGIYYVTVTVIDDSGCRRAADLPADGPPAAHREAPDRVEQHRRSRTATGANAACGSSTRTTTR